MKSIKVKNSLLLLVICHLGLLVDAQTTYIPDDNFEQALIDMGYDDVLDDYVLTANINTVDYLYLYNKGIFNLMGIEDFTALEVMNVVKNQLSSLVLNQNVNLWLMSCDDNQLIELDVSQNINLIHLSCTDNLLNSLNVSNNVLLEALYCGNNYISELDLRYNINLESFSYDSYSHYPYMQAIESIDLRNGNNHNISLCSIDGNVNLKCVFVDDTNAPHSNWSLSHGTYVNNEAECDAILSISNFNEKSMEVYPNPVSNILFIENTGNLNIQRIEVYNILGGLIMNLSNGFDQVNFEEFSPGLYFVNIQTENGLIKKKIIKI